MSGSPWATPTHNASPHQKSSSQGIKLTLFFEEIFRSIVLGPVVGAAIGSPSESVCGHDMVWHRIGTVRKLAHNTEQSQATHTQPQAPVWARTKAESASRTGGVRCFFAWASAAFRASRSLILDAVSMAYCFSGSWSPRHCTTGGRIGKDGPKSPVAHWEG